MLSVEKNATKIGIYPKRRRGEALKICDREERKHAAMCLMPFIQVLAKRQENRTKDRICPFWLTHAFSENAQRETSGEELSHKYPDNYTPIHGIYVFYAKLFRLLPSADTFPASG